MKDSKLAEGGLGKKRDIKIAKGLIKSLQGVDNEASREMKALMNEVLRGGYKPVKKAMGGEVMDTTKSMPVGMMDGGKVKPMKMNMGGVVPGRGGKFKGVR